MHDYLSIFLFVFVIKYGYISIYLFILTFLEQAGTEYIENETYTIIKDGLNRINEKWNK